MDQNANLDALEDLLANSQELSGEAVTVTEPQSQAPAGEDVTGEAKGKKTRKPREIKNQSALFAEYNIGNDKTNITVDSIAGQLMRVNSKLSEIAGFIVPASPRFDIMVSRNKVGTKDNKHYETKVVLKEKFGTQIKGIVYNYIPELEQRISEEKVSNQATSLAGVMKIKEANGEVVEVPRKTPEMFENQAATLTRVTGVKGYDDFVQWALDYCWYEISEAPSIFWAHKVKSTRTKDGVKEESIKVINTPADLKSGQGTGYFMPQKVEEAKKRYEQRLAKNAGKLTKSNKPKVTKVPTLKDIFPLVSKYRGKKLAVQGNFIAMKKYVTVPTSSSYTAEDQAEFNKKYIADRFSPNNKTAMENKISSMTAEAKEYVTIDNEGNVTNSRFFASSNSMVADPQYLETVYRYWGKVDVANPVDVRLVSRVAVEVPEKTDKQGNVKPAYTKYVDEFIDFGKENNTLANSEYRKVVEATNGRLTDGDVTAFISTLVKKNNKGNENTRGGINYDVTIGSSNEWLQQLASWKNLSV